MTKKLAENKYSSSKIVAIVSLMCFGVVLAFFMTTIMLMTMSAEDILHQNSTISRGWVDAMVGVYNYLPRVGEFLQRFAMQFYDYQTMFNGGLIWRLFDVAICFLAVYFITMLSLGRKLKPSLVDSSLFLLVSLLLILSRHKEVFMMRFSFIHNYIPILIFGSLAGYILLYAKRKPKKLMIIGSLFTGIILGMSSEIVPLAFLAIIMLFIAWNKIINKIAVKDILMANFAKTFLVVGIIIGFMFMISNGALFNRGSQAYGEIYDYVSLFDIFRDTKATALKLLSHFIYNGRYLLITLVPIFGFLLAGLYLKQQKKRQGRDIVKLQGSMLAFILLYMIATSQLQVLEDLYPRFMSPVYAAVVVSVVSFIYQMVINLKIKTWHFGVVITILFSVMLVAIADVARGFSRSSSEYEAKLLYVKNNANDNVCINKVEFEKLYYSPVFKFTQISPFEEWTGSKMYGKSLNYSIDCTK